MNNDKKCDHSGLNGKTTQEKSRILRQEHASFLLYTNIFHSWTTPSCPCKFHLRQVCKFQIHYYRLTSITQYSTASYRPFLNAHRKLTAKLISECCCIIVLLYYRLISITDSITWRAFPPSLSSVIFLFLEKAKRYLIQHSAAVWYCYVVLHTRCCTVQLSPLNCFFSLSS